MYCVVSTDGRLDVNVALNRSSSQVSTYSDVHGIYYAMYANDGGHGTNKVTGPCMITQQQANPWWAVDLGVALHVRGVKFTNKDIYGTSIALSYTDSCRLQHFSVLLHNAS